jgi:2-oxoglutarate dehydrogenase E1 component
LGELHRPLIVMTPKSMLRNKLAVSDPADFTQGSWKPVLGDPTIEDPSQVSSVLLCSGKIRWELMNARSQAGKDGQVAIIAVERLYPLPMKDLIKQLKRFDGVEELRWVQDEPGNQGAWPFMALNLPARLAEMESVRTWQLTKVTRPESSAPSVGSTSVHQQQQRALMEAAFG